MIFSTRLCLPLLGLLTCIAWAGSVLAANPSLDELVGEGLRNNPDLQAAEERWHQAEHKIVPARTLDDPMLGFAFSNYPVDTFDADQTPMTGNEVKLSQNLPYPGKLAAKGKQAEQQALANKAMFEDARLQLVRRIKETYFRLYFLDQAIAVTDENLRILESFISLTKTRYEVGSGLQQDLLKAQVEQSKTLDKLITLRQQRASTLAGFNQLLARPSGSPLEIAFEPQLVPVALDRPALKQAARTNRPMFDSFQAQTSRYQSQREFARLDSYPNFNVWASYRFRDDDLGDGGTDFASAGIGLTLPIWREKRSEQVEEAEAGLRMTERQRTEFGNTVDAAIEDISAELEKNRDLARLLATGIIPQAEQSFDASLAAYQVGKVEFLSLLDSLMTLYRYQLDHQRALADYQRNLAQLEAATGIDPTRASDTNPNSVDRTSP